MTGPIVPRSGEDWEVVNDDGFIYKRRIKERKSISQAPKRLPRPTQPQDERDLRRQSKKAALQQMKARFLAEICEWETLFKNLERPSQNSNRSDDVLEPIASPNAALEVPEDNCQTMLKSLSFQVEKLESCIEDFKTLCCEAEYMCKCLDGDEVFRRQFDLSFILHALQSPES